MSLQLPNTTLGTLRADFFIQCACIFLIVGVYFSIFQNGGKLDLSSAIGLVVVVGLTGVIQLISAITFASKGSSLRRFYLIGVVLAAIAVVAISFTADPGTGLSNSMQITQIAIPQGMMALYLLISGYEFWSGIKTIPKN